MIYFACPACREELEAEDSIRGVRMKCPACARELEVPQASTRSAAREGPRHERRGHPTGRVAPVPGGQFIAAVLAAGAIGLLVLVGVGYVLNRQVRGVAGGGSSCVVCAGRKNVTCARCAGAKTMPCAECSSTGRRKNWREEEEMCFSCNGTGRGPCRVCGGTGEYSCDACFGTGKEGAEPPPLYDFR